jgi:uncharacterized protein YprB with RNaseH-like and TPR domain
LITEALQHLPGIGPVRLAKLHAAGVRSWIDVVANAERIPTSRCEAFIAECQRCLAALEARDVRYFVDRFSAPDKWRIISHFIEETTFFDIETQGLEWNAPITVIGCWHRGQLLTFVEHENLDEFLELLDDVTLLASFNGSSFDVPRVLDTFHIPRLPCPHLDLRWICYHRGWRGSLKEITERLGISRPNDLRDADGALAVHLWNSWIHGKDPRAKQRLLRYCGADVLLLVMLAHHVAGIDHSTLVHLWSQLAEVTAGIAPLRTRRIRFAG